VHSRNILLISEYRGYDYDYDSLFMYKIGAAPVVIRGGGHVAIGNTSNEPAVPTTVKDTLNCAWDNPGLAPPSIVYDIYYGHGRGNIFEGASDGTDTGTTFNLEYVPETTPPTASTCSHASGAYPEETEIGFTPGTDDSPPITLHYRLNGGTWIDGTPGEAVQITLTGDVEVEWYGTDAALNAEAVQSRSYTIAAAGKTRPGNPLTGKDRQGNTLTGSPRGQ
jgi:hypothetical protein